MAGELVDIADLDCIYLSYDEPQKEEFWVQIQNIVPWAKRVDGVEGSDAAHKAAAAASDTERFVLIDGDNIPSAYWLKKGGTESDTTESTPIPAKELVHFYPEDDIDQNYLQQFVDETIMISGQLRTEKATGHPGERLVVFFKRKNHLQRIRE